MRKIILLLIVISLLITACTEKNYPLLDKDSKIPADAIKITPKTDLNPPKLHSSEWQDPVPLDYPVNTAGAEDSPFITPDGKTLYFFFTPDVRVPVEKQILDGVTGIYVSHQQGGKWSRPERVVLQDKNKLSLDGCEFVDDNVIWFCSAREGYTGLHWFTAEFQNNKWQNWKNADFNPKYKVGELHFINNGKEVYFHSDRAGGKGGLDLWLSRKADGQWSEPENIEAVNSQSNEGWPFVTEDGKEIWFTKDYGIWQSKKIDWQWSKPEEMISSLAGEPSLDKSGNIYFVHHFFNKDQMLETDIYVAYRK